MSLISLLVFFFCDFDFLEDDLELLDPSVVVVAELVDRVVTVFVDLLYVVLCHVGDPHLGL